MNMDAPPFPRGQLGTGYSDPNTIDPTGLTQLEGMEWVFPDMDWTVGHGAQPQRSNRQIRCRCVRNTKAGTLLPKRLVKFDTGGGTNYDYGNKVSDYAAVGDAGGVVDEFLVTGPAQNDLFWLVIEGPSLITGDNSSTFAIGAHGVTSGTNGTLASVAPSGTAATIFAQIQGTCARVMQTVGAPTAGDIMCDVIRYR